MVTPCPVLLVPWNRGVLRADVLCVPALKIDFKPVVQGLRVRDMFLEVASARETLLAQEALRDLCFLVAGVTP